MGPDLGDAHTRRGKRLTRVAQVVPDLPTFSVDDGFSYSVPESISGVSVGSVVRVPLGGRRVRGFVVGIRDVGEGDRKLKDVAAVSGDLPIFEPALLETLRWAAIHYVAPLAALLPRPGPPNLPRLGKPSGSWPDLSADEGRPSPVPLATSAAAEGRRIRPQYLLTGRWSDADLIALVREPLAAGRSAMVIAPTVAEAEAVEKVLRTVFGKRVGLATSSRSDAAVTRFWVTARTTPGSVVVGTREAVFWPVAELALVLVVEEGRRGMKAKATPTTHVREVARRRSGVERFQLVMTGPVPTMETVAAGYEVTGTGRPWPLVEVVDRSEEPPGSGFVSQRVRRALSAVGGEGRRAFVLVHNRGYAPAFRCTNCRTVRRCAVCGAAADRSAVCRRCSGPLGACANCGGQRFEPMGAGVGRIVEEITRSAGPGVSPVGAGSGPILVGTERDLPAVGPVDLAVAIDLDGIVLAPHYRSAEDGLRLGARLANLVGKGSGKRCMIQTSMPHHEVIVALRRGRPLDFLAQEMEIRSGLGFPPAGELMAIDVRGNWERVDPELRDVAGDLVRGPADAPDGKRWLVQGNDLRDVKVRLRGAIQTWRDSGAKVRVDVDPIDL